MQFFLDVQSANKIFSVFRSKKEKRRQKGISLLLATSVDRPLASSSKIDSEKDASGNQGNAGHVLQTSMLTENGDEHHHDGADTTAFDQVDDSDANLQGLP